MLNSEAACEPWGGGGLQSLFLLPGSRRKKWWTSVEPVLALVRHVLLHEAGVFLGNYCCDPK